MTEAADLRAACDAARRFPFNTCGASRHTQMIADALANYGFDEQACSLYATVEALWRLRTQVQESRLEGKW